MPGNRLRSWRKRRRALRLLDWIRLKRHPLLQKMIGSPRPRNLLQVIQRNALAVEVARDLVLEVVPKAVAAIDQGLVVEIVITEIVISGMMNETNQEIGTGDTKKIDLLAIQHSVAFQLGAVALLEETITEGMIEMGQDKMGLRHGREAPTTTTADPHLPLECNLLNLSSRRTHLVLQPRQTSTSEIAHPSNHRLRIVKMMKMSELAETTWTKSFFPEQRLEQSVAAVALTFRQLHGSIALRKLWQLEQQPTKNERNVNSR